VATDNAENLRVERTRSLELAIEEQRKDGDLLRRLHESVKVKNITFLAASLGLAAYLYTSNLGGNIQQRLFIPKEPYGVIFYGLGLILLLFAVGVLMVALGKVRNWHTAYEDDQDSRLMNDYEEYLSYMNQRYTTISTINGSCYEKQRYLVNLSFFPMVLGATILLLLKTFGG
jgi:hypothetical protein